MTWLRPFFCGTGPATFRVSYRHDERPRSGQAGAAGIARLLLCAAAATLLTGASPAPPQRILSLMQCTDLLVLALVPRSRIASITYLAHPAVEMLMPGRDRGVAINHGTAEEILRQKPDLILAGTFSTPAARRLAARVGAPLIEVGPATSFADIRATTRRIGLAVGELQRAEAMIQRMDATLHRLAATRPRRARRVVGWDGSGSVPGRGTLPDAIIRAAGAINIAATRADDRAASFDVEQLLAARPDAILQGRGEWRGASLNATRAAHPLVRRLYRGRRIAYSDSLYSCGLPQTAEAALDLRRALRALPAGPVGW
jgi:iron complex transport system substrate-binding protein